ncbi:small heat shock protein C4, partial [Trifolium medium]|nr:small heat shock protein C4 [Trifolium medium]
GDLASFVAPKTNVAKCEEAEGKYVIMVEVPGVNVGDIRVEVDDQK